MERKVTALHVMLISRYLVLMTKAKKKKNKEAFVQEI